MKILTTIVIAGVLSGATASATFADISNSELRRLRLSPLTDQNRDGRVTAEEVLRARPSAFDSNGDGRLDARERGVALQRLRLRRLN